MKYLSLFTGVILFLAAFSVASSFAADSEGYIGHGSDAPEYEVKDGQLAPAHDNGHSERTHNESDDALHHSDGPHEEVDGLPQLDFSTYPSQIFWLFIAFAILYFIFSKKTLPEISSAIESRREQVEGDIDSANKQKEEAEEVHAAYEEILSKARQQASEEFSKVEDAIKENYHKKLEEFKGRADKQTAETENVITEAKKDAINDMHSIAAEVASAAAKKIVGISADFDSTKTLVKNIDRKAA